MGICTSVPDNSVNKYGLFLGCSGFQGRVSLISQSAVFQVADQTANHWQQPKSLSPGPWSEQWHFFWLLQSWHWGWISPAPSALGFSLAKSPVNQAQTFRGSLYIGGMSHWVSGFSLDSRTDQVPQRGIPAAFWNGKLRCFWGQSSYILQHTVSIWQVRFWPFLSCLFLSPSRKCLQ